MKPAITQTIKILKNGGVAVVPTDTLYGLVGQASNKKTVARIYKIKGRSGGKPFIILISSIKDLETFEIKTDNKLGLDLKKFWPGPTSIILPCKSEKFKYLHRGTKTLAFRLPRKNALLNMLRKTGPMVAPSANPQNLPPAKSAEEARLYFGDKVDFYLNGLKPKHKPSRIIKINNEVIEIVRN